MDSGGVGVWKGWMRASRIKKAKLCENGSLYLPQKGIVGRFVLGQLASQLLLFRCKELAGQKKGDSGAAGLCNRGQEGCPQLVRTYGTRIWGTSPCLYPFRASPTSIPSVKSCRLGSS